MAVPYMGSKRKSAQKIYQTIANFNPDAKVLADIFCGGFAISSYFIKQGWEVISNDKNKYVVALINQTSKGLDEKKCLEFVSRELFTDVLKNPDKYEDWYVGYVQCICSFGNNQQNYMYGKDKEKAKLSINNLVVNKDFNCVIGLIPKKYIDGIVKQKDWHTRRMALRKVIGVLEKKNNLLCDYKVEEQLLRLEILQKLQFIKNLKVTALSYNEVIMPAGAIIYCDPPYAGTAEYKEGGFNHKEFWDWVRKISSTNKIYISEYTAPSDFKPLLEFSQKSTLQGGVQKHNNQPNECLFVPINQEAFETK
jgi:DNA adenine methylase